MSIQFDLQGVLALSTNLAQFVTVQSGPKVKWYFDPPAVTYFSVAASRKQWQARTVAYHEQVEEDLDDYEEEGSGYESGKEDLDDEAEEEAFSYFNEEEDSDETLEVIFSGHEYEDEDLANENMQEELANGNKEEDLGEENAEEDLANENMQEELANGNKEEDLGEGNAEEPCEGSSARKKEKTYVVESSSLLLLKAWDYSVGQNQALKKHIEREVVAAIKCFNRKIVDFERIDQSLQIKFSREYPNEAPLTNSYGIKILKHALTQRIRRAGMAWMLLSNYCDGGSVREEHLPVGWGIWPSRDSHSEMVHNVKGVEVAEHLPVCDQAGHDLEVTRADSLGWMKYNE
ncbi:hypothetical protein DFJ77DRAFT_439415 [Powellomyces hirtus]|nr:hypothetical protein DFJ77DRAFT_439415 [Powellomyces hirtus]